MDGVDDEVDDDFGPFVNSDVEEDDGDDDYDYFVALVLEQRREGIQQGAAADEAVRPDQAGAWRPCHAHADEHLSRLVRQCRRPFDGLPQSLPGGHLKTPESFS